MKKIILLVLCIMLVMPLFVSCSEEDEAPPIPFTSDPKPDIKFKGADLNTIQKAVQGSWWLTKTGTAEYKEGESQCLIIRGNKIAYKTGSLWDGIGEPKWSEMMWREIAIEPEGEMMYAFSSLPDNPEMSYAMFFIPYQIEDNVLCIGIPDITDCNYFSLLLKK